MNNKEIVQQGLNARKEARAARDLAKKYQADVVAANDARLHDHITWNAERASMKREQDALAGIVFRQRETIQRLRDDNAALQQRQRLAQRRQTMFGIAKSVAVFILTICAWRVGWVATNLTMSLLSGCTGFLVYGFAKLIRNI